jgi:hypothetical protein
MPEAAQFHLGCGDCELSFQCVSLPYEVRKLAIADHISVAERIDTDTYIEAGLGSGHCFGPCPGDVNVLREMVDAAGIDTITSREATSEKSSEATREVAWNSLLRLYARPRTTAIRLPGK